LPVVTSISLQYNNTVTAYTVRFLPDWNAVTEVTITKCTTDIDTVHSPDTAHIQHLFSNYKRIMDKSNTIIAAHTCQK